MKPEKSSKIEEAIQHNHLPIYRGRAVGLPCQLARLTDTAQSTVRYAYSVAHVRFYELQGATLVIDAQDLADYFRDSRPGRKTLSEKN